MVASSRVYEEEASFDTCTDSSSLSSYESLQDDPHQDEPKEDDAQVQPQQSVLVEIPQDLLLERQEPHTEEPFSFLGTDVSPFASLSSLSL